MTSGTVNALAAGGAGGSFPAPYQYDPGQVDALAALADAACEAISDPHEAGLKVGKLAAQAQPPVADRAAAILRDTFLYTIEVAPADAQPNATLEPTTGRSLLPPALSDADEQARQMWLDLAGKVQHPVARARCWDIVFTLQLVRNKRQSATHAIAAYVDAATTTLSPHDKANGLVRAWTMARLVGITNITAITAAMKVLAEDAIASQGDPYAAVIVLNALIAPSARRQASTLDATVDALLDRALLAFPQSHIIREFAVLVRKSAGNGAPRAEAARRHEVAAMLAEAGNATDPMIIRMLYGSAASAAREYGLADLEQAAVSVLQTAEEVQWQSAEFSMTVPARYFDLYLPSFRDAIDWRQALAIWFNSGPPSGSFDANRSLARKTLDASVFRRLVTTVLFRDGDLPARTLNGDDDLIDRELVQAETISIRTHGSFLARALLQVPRRFGIPSTADLTEFLLTSGAAPNLVNALATALHLFWARQYAACSHLIVPKAEAAARALLLEINEPLYRAAVGDIAGQFPGLGALLPSLLENDFDPDWERFLRTFLLSDGNNVRNLLAHGYGDDGDPLEAALAIRASALLILLASDRAHARDAATVRQALTKPVSRSKRSLWKRLRASFLAALWEFRR